MGWLKKNPEDNFNTNDIPSSLVLTLNALDRESIIIDTGGNIVFSTEKVSMLNLVKDERLSSQELLALVRVVRRTGTSREGSFEVARGPIGESKRELQITATLISDDGLVLVIIDDEGEKLKTPIQALSLNADAILEVKDEPEKVVTFANKIKLQTNRLNDLVREIINLSKLQDSDPMETAQEVEISDVIKEAIDQCESPAQVRKITINTDEVEESTVFGKREQLVMAVHNLVENAINYSPEGTAVTVSTKKNDNIIEILVKDQGLGISEENIERIFERFYRVDPARSRATGGTGLGLSIVKHVVGNHGGEVKVWSALGVGSTFAIRLPIAVTKGDK
jgi:two-component system, OmpR family, sensor histidine kinase SenX3